MSYLDNGNDFPPFCRSHCVLVIRAYQNDPRHIKHTSRPVHVSLRSRCQGSVKHLLRLCTVQDSVWETVITASATRLIEI